MVMIVTPAFAQFNTIGLVSPRQKIEPVAESDNSPIDSEIDSNDGDVMDDKDAASDTSLTCFSLSCVSLPLQRIKVNSPFGWRKDPVSSKDHTLHNGLDLYARNDNVMAMLTGVVEKTGSDSRAGLYVVLRHGNIRVSYCHLSKILVVQGRNVSAGDVIGVTGSTGRSSGEHLHLVTKQNGRVFNPTIMIDFINRFIKRQGCQIRTDEGDCPA